MDSDTLEIISVWLNYGFPVLLILLAYFIGTIIEKRHFRNIRAREKINREYPVVSLDTMPEDWNATASTLVTGSVVISLDYFKRVIAGLRAIVGGRIKTYEPLLERARREAVLRMTESARRQGYDAIFNVRLETSRLANSRGDGNGTAGVEMLAFGTAVRRDSRFAPVADRI
ncbi:MAG: YbjQ family protein [Gammaproteobacteria bacterium]|nr:YbjQ family protein [Gammaproteobacteria bacterium]NNF49055.1 heavy metal-binding domain-containing protein [Woeseiaceae bacterium]MBT8094852.1 YbjQ family protein [Gammaproteobacteria bacterium]MBT8104216.1 YbjQ family protein [Gammaproteobacteria bacterium]NNK24231.1 heavy metal-binding domain-containing protein [Woeseiaceae bacterium]